MTPYHTIKNIKLTRLAKSSIIYLVLLLPFQTLPEVLLCGGGKSQTILDVPIFIKIFRYTDEVTLLLFALILFAFMLVKPNFYKIDYYPFTKWIIIFILFNIILIFINQIPFYQGFFSIYNYLKNIIVVYLCAWLAYDRIFLQGFLKKIALMMVALAVIGIAGEFFAMTTNIGIDVIVESTKRFGFYRVVSLTGPSNKNFFGVFAVLIFYLIYANKKNNYFSLINLTLIGITIFLTFSRQAWLGFILLFFLNWNRRVIPIFFSLLLIFVVLSLPFYKEIAASLAMGAKLDSENYFRYFAFLQAVNLAIDHPFFGIGPGMFGGITSFIFESPVYNNWPSFFYNFAYEMKGIDQYWPGICGDIGLLGFGLYIMIFISMNRYLKKIIQFFKKNDDMEMFNLGRVLRNFMWALFIMGFFGGLNSAMVSFTYFSLIGMYISVYFKSKQDLPT